MLILIKIFCLNDSSAVKSYNILNWTELKLYKLLV